ncbi:hypothetical protein D3C81_1890950 [compost metagenome]
MLLDHQVAAFGLLHGNDRFVQAAVPGLLVSHIVEAVVVQLAAEQAEQGAVVVILVGHQQVQARTGGAGDQFGPGQGTAMGVLGIEDHQNAAYFLHERELPSEMATDD